MRGVPAPAPPRWRPVLARTVREALAAAAAVAQDTVLRGTAAVRGDAATLRETAVAPLSRLGLDRAAAMAEGLVRRTGTVDPDFVRDLVRAMLLGRMAARFPDGPAEPGQLEPLLRARRPQGQGILLRGRVLSPLVVLGDEGLVWDVAAACVMRVTSPALIHDRVLLARTVLLDPGHPTPLAAVGRVTNGPRAEACDRRMLRHALGSFDAVARRLAAELGDPFPRDPAPVLVGPFRFAGRASDGGMWSLVQDARGLRAVLRYPAPSLESRAGDGSLYALSRAVSRKGQLTLLPQLIWMAGRRVPVTSLPVNGTAWEDGVVSELAQKLTRVMTNGLDANYAVRAEVAGLVPHLRAAGFRRLSELAERGLPLDGPADPLRFAAAAHMTYAVLATPRWLELGEAA